MNDTPAGTTPTPALLESCQDRRRAAKSLVMLARAKALFRRAGSANAARASLLQRRANTLRHMVAEGDRLHALKMAARQQK